jgi:hypothetical protein
MFRVLSKEMFFEISSESLLLKQAKNRFAKIVRPGRRITLVLTTKRLPRWAATGLKGGFFPWLFRFIPTFYKFSGVCVSTRLRGFGSSFVLRVFTETGFFDRSFLLFSPFLLGFHLRAHSSSYSRFKQKLYFLSKKSINIFRIK